jgi:hypothetical protein
MNDSGAPHAAMITGFNRTTLPTASTEPSEIGRMNLLTANAGSHGILSGRGHQGASPSGQSSLEDYHRR